MGVTALATDLDGTLIPLQPNAENQRLLENIKQLVDSHQLALLYVTGRHFASVQQAIDQYQLPPPDWLICDVGATLMQRQGSSMTSVQSYHDELAKITAGLGVNDLATALAGVAGLRQQEAEKQSTFKLSYYTDARRLDSITTAIDATLARLAAPYSVIASIDPFNGDGLIDLLPLGVSKAFALRRWAEYAAVNPETIVFSGDSGNDLAALTAGYQAIVVANAADEVVKQVRHSHQQAGWGDSKLYLARHAATRGVLEGLRFYLARV